MAVRSTPRFQNDSLLSVLSHHPDSVELYSRLRNNYPVDRFEAKLKLTEEGKLWNRVLSDCKVAHFPPDRSRPYRLCMYNDLPDGHKIRLAACEQKAHIRSAPTSLEKQRLARVLSIIAESRPRIKFTHGPVAMYKVMQLAQRTTSNHPIRDSIRLAEEIAAVQSPGNIPVNSIEVKKLLCVAAAESKLQPFFGACNNVQRWLSMINRVANRRTKISERRGPGMRVGTADEVISTPGTDSFMNSSKSREIYNTRLRLRDEAKGLDVRFTDDYVWNSLSEHVTEHFNSTIEALDKEHNEADITTDAGWDDFVNIRKMRDKVVDDAKIFAASVSDVACFSAEAYTCNLGSSLLGTFTSSYVVLEDPNTTIFVTRSDLEEVLEHCKEVLSVLISACVESQGTRLDRFVKLTNSMLQLLCSSSDDQSNMITCYHRNFEGVLKNWAAGAFPDSYHDSYYDEELKKMLVGFGDNLRPFLSVFGYNRDSDPMTAYEEVRAMRFTFQHHFSVAALHSEAVTVYSLNPVPQEGALERLRTAALMTLALMHRRKHGVWPASLVRHWRNQGPGVERVASSTERANPEHYAEWVPDNDAAFDWEAMRTRDKSNVSDNIADYETPEKMSQLPPEVTREALYYIGKDPYAEAKDYYNKLSDIKSHVHPVILTVKPEPKEFGRVITMECHSKRRFNSLVNNNLGVLMATWPGSLLGSSASSKASEMQSIINRFNNHILDGRLPYHVVTDFKKFGHNIPLGVQRVLYRILAQYFGLPNLANMPNSLLTEDFVVSYMGFMSHFDNVTGADGQGMRNMVWQWLLASMPYAVLTDLPENLRGIDPTVPVRITFFMDDHHFDIVMSKPRGKISIRTHCHNKVRILNALARSYAKYGIIMEASKGLASITGFPLLGDLHTNVGLTRVITKGAAGLLKKSDSRCPAFADRLAISASTGYAMVAAGATVVDSWVVATVGVSITLHMFSRRSMYTRSAHVAVLLCAPRALGGVAWPLIQHMIGNVVPNTADDALHILQYHAVYETTYKDLASNVIDQPAATRERAFSSSSPLIRPVTRIPIYKSPLVKHIVTALKSRGVVGVDSASRSVMDCCVSVWSASERLPWTVVPAIRKSHPSEVINSELNRLCESSSSTALVGRGLVTDCLRTADARGRQWITSACKPSVGVLSKLPTFELLCDALLPKGPTLTGPMRMPSRLLIQKSETDDPLHGDFLTVECSEIRHAARGVYYAKGSSGEPFASCGGEWSSPARTALINAVNCIAAESVSTRRNATTVFDCLSHSWSPLRPAEMITSTTAVVPFRDVPALTFSPPVVAPGLSRFYGRLSTSTLELSTRARELGLHVNYPAIESMLAMYAMSGIEIKGSWEPSKALLWKDPEWLPKAGARPTLSKTVFPEVTAQLMLFAARRTAERVVVREAVEHVEDEEFKERTNRLVAARDRQLMLDMAFLTSSAEADIAAKDIQEAELLSPKGVLSHKQKAHAAGIASRKTVTELLEMVYDSIASAVHFRLAIHRVSVADVLSKYGKVNTLAKTQRVASSDDYKSILPLPSECESAMHMAERLGCRSHTEGVIRRKWREVLKGVMPADARELSDVILHSAKAMPGWWFSIIGRSITRMPRDSAAFVDASKRRAFMYAWSDRYKSKFNHFAWEFKLSRAVGSSTRTGTGFSDEAATAYSTMHAYGMLCTGFRKIGDALSDTKFNHEDVKQVTEAFDRGCSLYLSRLMYKWAMRPSRHERRNDVNTYVQQHTRTNMLRCRAIAKCEEMFRERRTMVVSDISTTKMPPAAHLEFIRVNKAESRKYAIFAKLPEADTAADRLADEQFKVLGLRRGNMFRKQSHVVSMKAPATSQVKEVQSIAKGPTSASTSSSSGVSFDGSEVVRGTITRVTSTSHTGVVSEAFSTVRTAPVDTARASELPSSVSTASAAQGAGVTVSSQPAGRSRGRTMLRIVADATLAAEIEKKLDSAFE